MIDNRKAKIFGNLILTCGNYLTQPLARAAQIQLLFNQIMHKNYWKQHLLVVAVLFAVAVVFSLISFNQSKLSAQTAAKIIVVGQPVEKKAVEPTVLVKPATANLNFAKAAAQNLNLKNNLAWTFGGKAQRGWYIYELLINSWIQNNQNESDNVFALSVAKWQQSANLPANGVLDETSLAAMIKQWQANRLNFYKVASADELLLAPSEDFWDASRPAELRQVERETFAAYKKMVAAAAKDLKLDVDREGNLSRAEQRLKIVSSFRSPDYQQKLRAASPTSGTAGLAIHSPHSTGRALDIYVGGEPVTTRDDNRALQVKTPEYQWLVKNAARFGFKPYFYEPWHWEYAPSGSNK